MSAIYLPIHQTLAFRLHAFWPYSLGRMPLELLILNKTYSPKLRILDPFQQSKPPVHWVPCWLDAKGPHGDIGSQLLSCYCIATIGMIEHQRAVLIASNEPYSHHPHGGSKGLRLRVKLLTWLGLICRMTQSLARNCKAIRGDLDPQRDPIK